MIASLISLLVFMLVCWLVIYLIDQFVTDSRVRNAARVVVFVIAAIYLIWWLYGFATGLEPGFYRPR